MNSSGGLDSLRPPERAFRRGSLAKRSILLMDAVSTHPTTTLPHTLSCLFLAKVPFINVISNRHPVRWREKGQRAVKLLHPISLFYMRRDISGNFALSAQQTGKLRCHVTEAWHQCSTESQLLWRRQRAFMCLWFLIFKRTQKAAKHISWLACRIFGLGLWNSAKRVWCTNSNTFLSNFCSGNMSPFHSSSYSSALCIHTSKSEDNNMSVWAKDRNTQEPETKAWKTGRKEGRGMEKVWNHRPSNDLASLQAWWLREDGTVRAN